MLGHRIARQFGHVSKTGYSPFSWGQISQMPQIYKGFGIEFAAFYRGINTLVAPRSEIYWEGADGTKIVASRLGCRPRYNVWYVFGDSGSSNKSSIPDARATGPWPGVTGCFQSTSLTCTHVGSLTGIHLDIHHYQVRGVCGTTEAAE